MKKLNDNRAAMLRKFISEGDVCKNFADSCTKIPIFPILLKRDDITKEDYHLLKNILINRINFMKSSIEHYSKAIKMIENLEE